MNVRAAQDGWEVASWEQAFVNDLVAIFVRLWQFLCAMTGVGSWIIWLLRLGLFPSQDVEVMKGVTCEWLS